MKARSGLTRAAIVDVAAALVDRDGFQQLTMTALAKKLGVQGPSLYNHVEGIDAVLADVQVRALAELASGLQRAAVGRTREQAIRAFAAVHYRFAIDHPGLYDLAMSEAIDRERLAAAGEPAGSALTAVIESFGVADPTVDLSLTCLATLHGTIDLIRSGMFTGAVDAAAMYRRAVDLVVLLLQCEAGPPEGEGAPVGSGGRGS